MKLVRVRKISRCKQCLVLASPTNKGPVVVPPLTIISQSVTRAWVTGHQATLSTRSGIVVLGAGI